MTTNFNLRWKKNAVIDYGRKPRLRDLYDISYVQAQGRSQRRGANGAQAPGAKMRNVFYILLAQTL